MIIIHSGDLQAHLIFLYGLPATMATKNKGAPAFVRILKSSFVRIMGFYRVLTLSEWDFSEF